MYIPFLLSCLLFVLNIRTLTRVSRMRGQILLLSSCTRFIRITQIAAVLHHFSPLCPLPQRILPTYVVGMYIFIDCRIRKTWMLQDHLIKEPQFLFHTTYIVYGKQNSRFLLYLQNVKIMILQLTYLGMIN